MKRRIYPVDWRDSFSQLRPYLDGKGGAIQVRYSGRQCAPSAFLDALKSEYDNTVGGFKRCSIRLDKSVYSVRYLSGIRHEFMRLMGGAVQQTSSQSILPFTAEIAKNIQSDGSVNISLQDVGVYVHTDSPMSGFRDRALWVQRLCHQIEKFLLDGRMLVILCHGTADDQNEFWRYLWRDGLENLMDSGLVFLHMVDISDSSGIMHDLAPRSAVRINLPSALDSTAIQHAVDDMKVIFRREFPSMQDSVAEAYAFSIAVPNDGDIPKLHEALAAVLMKLGGDRGWG